ncbi:MAG: hypothetical protein ACRD0U_07720 [Acidimicrobiales bacterium]
MRRQLVIALIAIGLTLAGVAGAAVLAAGWLQDNRGEPPPPARVADAYGQIASLVTQEGFAWDDEASPMRLGPATLTVTAGTPVEVPTGTAVHGGGCELFAPGLLGAEAPAPGTDIVAADGQPCYVQLGLGTDGRVAWLLTFSQGLAGLSVSGEVRGVADGRIVLADGSTVPFTSVSLTGCDGLAATTVEDLADRRASVEIHVDPATGTTFDLSCTYQL